LRFGAITVVVAGGLLVGGPGGINAVADPGGSTQRDRQGQGGGGTDKGRANSNVGTKVQTQANTVGVTQETSSAGTDPSGRLTSTVGVTQETSSAGTGPSGRLSGPQSHFGDGRIPGTGKTEGQTGTGCIQAAGGKYPCDNCGQPSPGPGPGLAPRVVGPGTPPPNRRGAGGDQPPATPPYRQEPAEPGVPAEPDVINATTGIGKAPLPYADTPPVLSAPLIVAPGGSAGNGGAATARVPLREPSAGKSAPESVIRGSVPAAGEPLPATASLAQMSFRLGYSEYLRTAGVAQIVAVAVPGLAGILLLTAGGGFIGYRQAKAGHAVRTEGIARFLH
jgi:hypothetical protein